MATTKWYKVLIELHYPAGAISLKNARADNYDEVVWKDVKVDEVVDDIPSDAIEDLLKSGHIEATKAPKAAEKEG